MHRSLLQRLSALRHHARRAVAGRSWRLVPCFAVGCALIAQAPKLRATERVRLEWVRLEGAGSCIHSARLEARVRQRLGTDPFDPRAARSIEGVVSRVEGTWHAQVAVRARPDDPDPPLRRLWSDAADCGSLSDAVALAVALAIDPEAALSATETEGESVSVAPAPAVDADEPAMPVAAAPPSTAAAPARRALAGRLAPSATAALGLLPRASFGAALLGAVAIGEHFDVGLQATIFPAVRVAGDPGYEIGLAAGTAEACARLPWIRAVTVRACGGASAGVVHAALVSGDRAQPGERAWVAAELGVDGSVPLSDSLGVLLAVRGVVPITRYRFVVDGRDAELFEQAAVSGIARVGLELGFGSAP